MSNPRAPGHGERVEDALAEAIGLQRGGKLQQAEVAYRRLAEIAPDHPAVLHFSGVLAHQLGRSDEALRLIERSLALRPDQADWHSNHGIVLKERGRLDEAVVAYREATRLDPRHANAYGNLGILLRAKGNIQEAEAAYRIAIALAPDRAEFHHNLATLLAGAGYVKEAVTSFCIALSLDPGQANTRTMLAIAYYVLGERQKAVELFERWLVECPDDPVARHMLAACSGRDVPDRASDAYVEKTFDDFAGSFEYKLAKLAYRAPRLVVAALEDAGTRPEKRLAVLDAGCGTGLCGPLVAPYASRLVGVDLSARMLDLAREKRVYDELLKEELTAHLAARAEAYDLVVSADTLVYFGALEPLAAAVARALRPDGMLVFTVEACDDTAVSRGYRINPHGRYSHRPEYVAAVLSQVGLEPMIASAELRTEAGEPVAGLVVRATRGGPGRVSA